MRLGAMAAQTFKAVVVGAGPAGLTAAYELAKQQASVLVLESDSQYVGGISRTVNYKGFRFDIGGHRFFSKSRAVEDLWTEIAGDDMLNRPRSSRIYYDGQFYTYPLKPFEALSKLGLVESLRCMLSFAKARINPTPNPKTFQDWVVNQFGERLFQIFFKTYTEKVWGMKCTEISADWAAQRIKGLSLKTALWNALIRKKPDGRHGVIKTLIDHFRYPRRGPGMVWDAAADRIRANGGKVILDLDVVQVVFDGQYGRWTVTARHTDGTEHHFFADHVISSAAIRDLVAGLKPVPPPAVRGAAAVLRYRDFLIVCLIVKDRNVFDYNWIYVHDAAVKVGRIQNFKSWSPEMVPDPALNCYGLEYFCFENDSLWSMPDPELIKLARGELA